MTTKRIWSLVFAGVLATSLVGCPGPSTQKPEPDGGAPSDTDAGQPPDNDSDAGVDAGTPGGPVVTTLDARGAFVPSPTEAILVGSKLALFGTKNVLLDPASFGRPSDPESWDGWMRSGLIALETDTGKATVYDSSNGLPLSHIVDDIGDYGMATTPIFDMTWLQKDSTFAMATWDFVIRGTIAADGSISFQSTRLKAVGQTEWAKTGHIAFAGGEIFVATDQGVAVVDPTTLATKRWLHFGTNLPSLVWARALSAGQVDGQEVVGIVLSEPDKAAQWVAMVKAGETNATVFDFSDGSTPISVYGMNGTMMVGATTSDLRGAIYAIGTSPDGLAMDVMLPPEAVVNEKGKSLFPRLMSWDETRGVLVVGGMIRTQLAGPAFGYGLVQFQGTADGTLWGNAEPVLPASDPYARQLPMQPDEIVFDAQGRMYFTGTQYCSEFSLRQRPVYRLERDDPNNPKLVRPYLSGIRDIKVDPEGNTWFATRDANPGMECDGAAVDEAVCRLRKDGACEVVPIEVNVSTDGVDGIDPTPGVYELAFGNPEKKQMAVATRSDATWLRTGETGRQLMTQYDPSVGLRMTAAAFGPDDDLWIGSEGFWDPTPVDDPELLNRRSPHGLGLIHFDELARPTATRRYVRLKSDQPISEEIEGMPSDTVRAILPLSGNRRVLVALARDREAPLFFDDHVLGELAPSTNSGGVVVVDDQTVTVLAAPEGKQFSDVFAVAEGGGGFYAVDTELGVLKLDLEGSKTEVWTAPTWAEGERPLSIAADDSGHIAVGTTQGLYVFTPEKAVTKIFGQQAYGYVWRLRFMADGALYAGTDNGLVRVALDGATLPAELGPASFADRTIWPLPPPCGGVDGCTCEADGDCAKGFYCQCDKATGCACAVEDPCVSDPGGIGCPCDETAPACDAGNVCTSDAFGVWSCQMDPAACANGACSCTDDVECPTNWYCDPTGACAEKQACDAHCTCSTTSGCSPGLVCRNNGIAGPVCGR